MNIGEIRLYKILKKIIFFLFISVIFLVIAVVLAEIFLQLTTGKNRIIIPSEKYGLEHQKSAKEIVLDPDDPSKKFELVTNNLGFRQDADTELIKKEGVERILMLGDSHLDGYIENKKNFSSLLEELINQSQPFKPVEVINAGLAGSSIVTQYLLLRDELLKFKPDQVIIATYLGNDFEELLSPNKPRYLLKNGKYIYFKPNQEENKDFLSFIYQVRKKFILPSLAWQVVNRCDFCFVVGRNFVPAESFKILLANKVDEPAFSQSFMQSYYFKNHPADKLEAVKIYSYVLGLIVDLAKENNFNLSFILIPSKLQIEPEADSDRINDIRNVLGIKEDSEEFFYHELVNILSDQDIPYLDFYEIYRLEKQQDKRNYYYTQLDYHINEVGNGIIAHYLFDFLAGKNQ